VAWFETMVAKAGIDLRLGHEATADDLRGFDAVVIATGVLPRDPGIPGQDVPNVPGYAEALRGAPVGHAEPGAVAPRMGRGQHGDKPGRACRRRTTARAARAQGHAVATESGKAGAAAGQDDRVESPRQTAGQGCGDAGGVLPAAALSPTGWR